MEPEGTATERLPRRRTAVELSEKSPVWIPHSVPSILISARPSTSPERLYDSAYAFRIHHITVDLRAGFCDDDVSREKLGLERFERSQECGSHLSLDGSSGSTRLE